MIGLINKKAVRETGTASHFKRSKTKTYPRRDLLSIFMAMVIVTIGKAGLLNMGAILGGGGGFVNGS
jgi:hypothetical protein